MSREAAELVRSLYEAFNRRDYANAVQCRIVKMWQSSCDAVASVRRKHSR